ncbi:MAG: lecithin retinol acyltransferase family protein [Proteobacteria bacterium]|nr:lecithin retinol acyltransferase family protein [Pseudomonadota bacterium]
MSNTELYSCRPGDHIRVKRMLYSHHGICIGNNRVIHYAPPPGKDVGDGIGWQQIFGADSQVNTIHETSLQQFIGDDIDTMRVINYKPADSYPPLKTVARALSRLGENGYNLWGNNCEHLASWCTKLQNPEDKKALWSRMRDGALLGLSTSVKSRHWQTMLAGAGLGVIAGATKYWLEDRELFSSYDEFAAYSSTLYFSLCAKQSPHPLGSAFYHSNQSYQRSLPDIPRGKPDNEILFVYSGSWLAKPLSTDWFITERALIQPGKQRYIDFHHLAAVAAHMGKLQLTDVDGKQVLLPARFLHADSLARFITAAVAGLPLEPREIHSTRLSRLRQLLLRWLGK